MSVDDYAQYLAQKYRLAISIAILNIKPADLTVDEFLNQIRTTINEQNTDIDDFDVTACSDDFIDSDQNHLNQIKSHDRSLNRHDHNSENNDHENGNVGIINKFQDNPGINVENKINDNGRINNGAQDDATQEYGKGMDRKEKNINNIDVSNDNKQRREKFRELINVLKGNDVVTTEKVVMNNQKIFQNSLQINKFDPNDTDLTQCDDNFSTTESIHVLNNIDKESHQKEHNETQRIYQTSLKDNLNNTHEKEINNKRKENDSKLCYRESKITKNDIIKENIEKSGYPDTNMDENNKIVHISNNINDIATIDKDQIQSINNLNDFNNITDKVSTNNQRQEIASILTQETYTDTHINTHYSESQMNVEIDERFIHGNKNTKDKDYNKQTDETNCLEIQNYSKNLVNFNKENDQQNITNKSNENLKHAELQNENKDEYYKVFENTAQTQNIDFDIFNKNKNDFENCNYFDEAMNNDCTNENGSTVFDETSPDSNIELTDKEKIPFKIIEEMNRVKIYLQRKDNEFSSGYSSQSKSSFGGSPQCPWIGQSASNLFSYLTNCSLVTSTQHITEQISEILGQLIDRLHDYETYPSFLEDVLSTVDGTLQMIYEEENYTFEGGQKKDEQMQRILLYNKSTHIQKFTIEKINTILQQLPDYLSADTEIQNINKIENLCYIFQILQVLLPKYQNQNSSQISRNEKILRKKDITDIWRKKWFENKIYTTEGSFEKCVFKECSDILNKMVINLMDDHPLIAFSALNCFNLIQN